jgi:16S rRNA (cytidine1402-2'-O)-methyltransferase
VNKFYLVGPVPEPRDLTLRAREVLRVAALLVVGRPGAARPWLQDLDAQTRILESGDPGTVQGVLGALESGDVAWLLVDLDELAGPGRRLMRALLEQGVEPLSVPGAPAMVSALAASGLPADRFTAWGLLPHSLGERQELWRGMAAESRTLVCQVPAADLNQVLDELLGRLGDRRIAICQGDAVWRGPVSAWRDGDLQGRVTLVIEGAEAVAEWSRERMVDEIRMLLAAGATSRDVTRQVARRSGWSRRRVYEVVLRVSREGS